MGAEPRQLTLLQRLQLLAGLEPHGLAGRDCDFGASARVAPDTSLARTNVEDAEAPQLDALAMRQSSLHAFKNRLNSHLGFGLGDSSFVYDFVNNVELDQDAPPGRTGCD